MGRPPKRFIRMRRHPARRARSPPGGRVSIGAEARETDGEPRAGADAAGDVDLAADRLDQVLDDREAQAGPAELAAPRLVDAVEPLEDAGQVVAGDADPGVGDLDARSRRSMTRATDADRAVLGRVLDGVVDQVVDDLADGLLVGQDQRAVVEPAGVEVRSRFLASARPRWASTHDSSTGTTLERLVVEDLLARSRAGPG